MSQEIDFAKELDSDFNFLGIHLMTHWAEQIRRYGALQQYTAERHKPAHKTNLKDGSNASNHNLNFLPQVITFQCHILSFEITELNLQALAQHRKIIAATCQVLPSSADLASPLSPQSYDQPEFMGPQNHRDGMHPDDMIKGFRALFDNMQDAMHRVAIYSGTQEFIKHKSGYKTYISDEQLHALERCIYHGMKVHVEGLDGGRISQMCQCTGSQSWRGGHRQNDCMQGKQRPGRCYRKLNRPFMWQL